MTELIVALDGPNEHDDDAPGGRWHSTLFRLFRQLYDEAGVRWFKIGPQRLSFDSADQTFFSDLFFDGVHVGMRQARPAKFFFDFKLADTADTVREAVKRFAGAEIAAVSTFTDEATEAALAGAKGSDLRVWRVLRLTDSDKQIPRQVRIGDGVICSVADLRTDVTFSSDIDKVCPGIRFGSNEQDGHKMTARPKAAIKYGATHIVVGRPIWQAADPVAAAKEFLEALR